MQEHCHDFPLLLQNRLYRAFPWRNFTVKCNPSDEKNTYFNIYEKGKHYAHLSLHHTPTNKDEQKIPMLVLHI